MTHAVDSPEFVRLARRGLVILTLINLFNYLDRYVLSALAETLKRDPAEGGLGLKNVEVGSLFTAFIVVYMLTSGIFGSLGDRLSRPRLIAVGVLIWSVATALGGLAVGFWSLFFARALVGVGEAAYGTISPSLLADYYPRRSRGRVFSIFFAAIPIGSALGFILGGYADSHFGWRAAFYIAGFPGLALAMLALTLMDPTRGIHEGGSSVPDAIPAGPSKSGGFRSYIPLFSNRPYRFAILGYAAATFAAGGLGAWMPAFLENARGATKSEATVSFGVITVLTGLFGTYVGGVLGDRLLKRTKHAYLWISGISTLIAAPFVFLALTLESRPLYLAAIVVGELFLFASTGPVNSAIVNSVRPNQRVAAVALSIFTIHLLGDVPSPPLIGWIADGTNLATGVLLVPAAVFVSGLVFTYGAWRGERGDRSVPAAAP